MTGKGAAQKLYDGSEPRFIEALADIVRFHRRQAGLTRVELARLAGVGKTVIFEVEHGKRTLRLETLVKILSTLNIRLGWDSPLRGLFLEERGDAPSYDSGPR